MIARPTRWIVSAILLLLVAGVALAIIPVSLQSGPNPSAQVGAPYSSALVATGGNPANYYFWITANPNLLPPGLILNAGSGAITGTPTTGSPP